MSIFEAYTFANPPKNGLRAYVVESADVWECRYQPGYLDKFIAHGLLHRTRESAEGHLFALNNVLDLANGLNVCLQKMEQAADVAELDRARAVMHVIMRRNFTGGGIMTTRYDWNQAPESAIAGTRDENGEGYWVTPTTEREVGIWLYNWTLMKPLDILDPSSDWRDSLELRPTEPTP